MVAKGFDSRQKLRAATNASKVLDSLIQNAVIALSHCIFTNFLVFHSDYIPCPRYIRVPLDRQMIADDDTFGLTFALSTKKIVRLSSLFWYHDPSSPCRSGHSPRVWKHLFHHGLGTTTEKFYFYRRQMGFLTQSEGCTKYL